MMDASYASHLAAAMISQGDGHGESVTRERADGRGPLSFTHHAYGRGARRNVAPDAVDYVMTHGRALHRTGVTFFFLGRRDIPARDRRASWAARLEGTIVIVATGGVVVTVYRDRRGLRAIARKMKYRLRDYGQPCDNRYATEDAGAAAATAPVEERATA